MATAITHVLTWLRGEQVGEDSDGNCITKNVESLKGAGGGGGSCTTVRTKRAVFRLSGMLGCTTPWTQFRTRTN